MADAPETVIKVSADTQPAEQAAESLFKTFSLGLTELNSGLELVNKAAMAISKTLEFAIDFTKAGEEIKAIGTRFEIIASQAGLIPENIAAGIEQAVKGTVDMEDALKAATNAIVTLNVGSERIPQLFELAKKSAALFGGEVTDRFEQLTMAVASGSTRLLRSIGLVIDADQVYKNYAATLGTTADKLTQNERQQAILNAVLETGAQRFKNINDSTTPVSENLKRQGVAVKELGDTFATFFNDAFGAVINQKIQSFTRSLEVLNIQLGEFLLGKAPTAAENIKLLNAQLNDLATARDMAAVRGDVGRLEQIEAESQAIRDQIIAQQSLMFQEQTKQAMQGNGIQITKDAAAANRDLAESTKTLADELKNKMIVALDAGMKKLNEMEDNARLIGTTIKNSLVNAISQSMQTLIGNLVKGKAAFADFGKVVLGLLGQMAIQIGTVLLSAGIGMLSLKFLDPTGAIAAGLGLIALGSILSAIGEGGGAMQEATNPNAAAADAVIASGDIYQQTQEEERAAAQTGVQVIVQGNIFDSRETGLQIAQIINDSFDLNGTIIRANA
jgi:hypothetical protein